MAIVSHTANQCLSELGYFPGITQKLDELLKANAQLSRDNVQMAHDYQLLRQAHEKLFEDNLKAVQERDVLLHEKNAMFSDNKKLVDWHDRAYVDNSHSVCRSE